MISLFEALKMSFRLVIEQRDKIARDGFQLSDSEMKYIYGILENNCPAFSAYEGEIKSLFRSFQMKRTHKKPKIKYEQLSLYR